MLLVRTSCRKTATRENGQRWDYAYDTLGQVTSAVKRFPNEASIPGHIFSYAFDGIGNRTSATHGGTDTDVTYTANALNQYTNITTEGGRFILGEAPAANTVTVNGSTAARAGGLGFYWKQITDNNTSTPLWSNDSVTSNGVTITGKTWTPKASVSPTHDEDGNLTSDGRWNYTWDAENRKTRMETTAIAAAAGVPRQRLDFVYDSQGRRVSKTVSTSTDSTNWTFASNTRFLYDGWNLIAEYSAPSASSTSLTLQATHTWGIDLSGTPQGAGGVGGLLCTSLNSQPSTLNCFPAFDGNGNVSAWIDGTGTLLARMDYSPFGQLIAQYKFTPAGDTRLERLRFGFSTKYTDSESGLIYYGYRYYDPVSGRWPSRDPIAERGGVNLYGFVENRTIDRIDVLGLQNDWASLHESKWQDSEFEGLNNKQEAGKSTEEIDFSVYNENPLAMNEATSKEVASVMSPGYYEEVFSLKDIIDKIKSKQKSCTCIKTLNIVTHGGDSTNGGILFKSGINSITFKERQSGKKLGEKLKEGMCKPSLINLTGCYAGAGTAAFVEGLREGSGSTVVASTKINRAIYRKATPRMADGIQGISWLERNVREAQPNRVEWDAHGLMKWPAEGGAPEKVERF